MQNTEYTPATRVSLVEVIVLIPNMIKLPECFLFSGSWGMFLESPVVFSGPESFFRLSMLISKYDGLIDLKMMQ